MRATVLGAALLQRRSFSLRKNARINVLGEIETIRNPDYMTSVIGPGKGRSETWVLLDPEEFLEP